MVENPHTGHRERLRKEFFSKNFNEKTPPHKILELLLFYCIPRQDTNILAHQLLNKYKTISGVLNASVEDLTSFNGITENNVVLLKLIPLIMRRCELERYCVQEYFQSIEEIGEYLTGVYFGLERERLGLLLLDAKNRLLSFDFMNEGDLSSVGVYTRDLIENALRMNAQKAIIVHNHPQGFLLPSPEDIEMTKNVADAFRHIGVHLIDHIVVNDIEYISMYSSKKYTDIFQ